MRISLVNGSLDNSRQGHRTTDGFAKGFEKVIRPYQPLGLLMLASTLRKANFTEIQVIDPDPEGLSLTEVVKKIDAFNPDIIGISCMSFSYLYCLSLATDLKHKFDIPIIIGGQHVAFYPKEVLTHNAFDIGVIADGEIPFLNITEALARAKSHDDFLHQLHRISGIVFREHGIIHQTPSREIFYDLDSLPFPAYDLVDIRNYDQDYLKNPVATIITSRGCPLRCSYCSRNKWDMVDRYHSPEYVLQLIEHAREMTGAESFYIVDDTFTYHQKRATKICRMIKNRNLNLQFSALTRVTHINREVVSAMTDAGLQCLSFGIESGDQSILNKMSKGQTIKQVRDAFKICHDYNMHTIAYFLVGHPEETKENIEKTISLIQEIQPEWFKANILTPYPGTKLYQELLAEGVIEDFWRRMTLEGKPFESPNISKHLSLEELNHYRGKINFMPYLRLKNNNLLKFNKIRNIPNAILSARWIIQCAIERTKQNL